MDSNDNNIIFANTAGTGADVFIDNDGDNDFLPSIVNLFNNDFNQSASGIFVKLPFPIDPSNLDNVDPLFVNPLSGDYHLLAGSPVINMGDNNAPELPATDKDGQPRIIGGVVDLGAFEFLDPVGLPDLTVSSLTSASLALIGGKLPVSATVTNVGGALAGTPFRLAFYLSTDATITAEDVFTGAFCDFAGLAVGEIGTCNLQVTVPASMPLGNFVLGAIVDDLDQVIESLETNNARPADTGPVELLADCALSLGLSHAAGRLNMDFQLGTINPARWDVWLLSAFGLNQLWSIPLAVVDTVVSFPVEFDFPSIGNVAILTALTTTQGGLACWDFAVVDTGGAGFTVRQLEDAIESSGILQQYR